jgi:hypothetical protein
MIELILSPLFEVFYTKITEKVIERYGDKLPFIYGVINTNLYKIENAKSLVEKINKMTIGESELKGIYNNYPKLSYNGDYNVSDSIKSRAEYIKDNRDKYPDIWGNGRVDILGVISDKDNVDWRSDPIDIDYETIDFYGIKAMREENIKPRIISGGALIICAEEEKIILHKRGDKSSTYPGNLHIFGGSFIGKDKYNYREVEGDENIIRTIKRELYEESGIDVHEDIIDKCRISLAEELSTGFFQVVALGVNITKKQLNKLRNNEKKEVKPEGKPIIYGFDEIEEIIKGEKMVPSGASHIMIWLGLGAPGAKRKSKFSGKSAQELFDDIINSQDKISWPKPNTV